MSLAIAHHLEGSSASFDTTNKFALQEIHAICNTHTASLDVKYKGCNQHEQDKYAHY
jgi:hypothetical protein